MNSIGWIAIVLLGQTSVPAEALKPSFVVRNYSAYVNAELFSKSADDTRLRLCEKWLERADAAKPWSPPCEVILHRDRASYMKAVGEAGQTTGGSTLVRMGKEGIESRRIDLMADARSKPLETLAHEIVHVIFAQRFSDAVPPKWAEEGAALLADTATKRAAHYRDLQHAMKTGTAFPMNQLVSSTDYPQPHRFPAFYGQSLALVEHLVNQSEPGEFLEFVKLSMEVGHEKALSDVYQIETIAELETQWRASLVTFQTTASR